MNKDVPDATAPAPLNGAEQAAAGQAAQQSPPEPTTAETVFNLVDGTLDGAAMVIDIVSIFD